jgi:hypothetical protein
MRPVRLRTTRPELFWILDNIHLSPYDDTSPPFDWDTVYPAGKEYIERSIGVFGRVELIDDPDTTEPLIDIIPNTEPVLELPNQPHLYAARQVVLNQEEGAVFVDGGVVPVEPEPEEVIEATEEEQLPAFEPDAPPPGVDMLEVTPENHKLALKLLAKKVNVVQNTIKRMPQDQDTRRFVMACIKAEEKRKNRKSIMTFLEEAFLAIPPEVN